MGRKVCINYGTGCPRALLDVALLVNYFSLNGWELSNNFADSDIIVVSACGVTSREERVNLNLLSVADTKRRSGSLIVVTGCLAAINKEVLLQFDNVLPVSRYHLDNFDNLIDANIKINKVSYPNELGSYTKYLYSSLSHSERFRAKINISGDNFCRLISLAQNYFKPAAELNKDESNNFFIKVVDGCLGECSYCALKSSTGQFRSRRLDDIMADMAKGLSEGYKTFRLIGEDIGAYGQDLGLNVVDLFEELTSFSNGYKLLIDDFSPVWFIRYFRALSDILAKNKDKFSFIGIPIQSGSDRILDLMNRGYSAVSIKEPLISIKKEIPDIDLRTHVIVGFPSETEKDFHDTLSFVKSVDFAKISIYKYSDRPNTLASNYAGKISEATKTKRILKLLVALKGKGHYAS